MTRSGRNKPTFSMGESDNTTTERILLLQSVFNKAGLNSVIPENIQIALWTKLMGIATPAGMECITRTPSGIWSRMPSLKAMFLKSMEETRSVAQILGIEIPYREIEQRFDRLGDRTGYSGNSGTRTGTTSMHKDIADGRPSAIEHQIGALCELPRRITSKPQ